MNKPPLSAAPEPGAFDGFTSPIDLIAAITRLAQTHGTLPAGLAALRKAAIREARQDHKVTFIAGCTGLSHGRISQLSKV